MTRLWIVCDRHCLGGRVSWPKNLWFVLKSQHCVHGRFFLLLHGDGWGLPLLGEVAWHEKSHGRVHGLVHDATPEDWTLTGWDPWLT